MGEGKKDKAICEEVEREREIGGGEREGSCQSVVELGKCLLCIECALTHTQKLLCCQCYSICMHYYVVIKERK